MRSCWGCLWVMFRLLGRLSSFRYRFVIEIGGGLSLRYVSVAVVR
jgi:hypothetical protein